MILNAPYTYGVGMCGVFSHPPFVHSGPSAPPHIDLLYPFAPSQECTAELGLQCEKGGECEFDKERAVCQVKGLTVHKNCTGSTEEKSCGKECEWDRVRGICKGASEKTLACRKTCLQNPRDCAVKCNARQTCEFFVETNSCRPRGKHVQEACGRAYD